MRHYLSICLVLFATASFAQIGEKDSLLNLAAHADHDTTRASYYLDLADHFIRESPYESQYYSEKALKLNRNAEYDVGTAQALTVLGGALARQGVYDGAIEVLLEAVELAEKVGKPTLRATAFNNLGNIYNRLGDYEKAITYLEESLEIHSTSGDKQLMSDVLNNLGVVYKYQYDYDKARELYMESMVLREEVGDASGVADLWNNLALLFIGKDSVTSADYDSAAVYFRYSMKVNLENNNYYGLSANYGNLSQVLRLKGDLDSAVHYALLGVDVSFNRGYRVILSNVLDNLYYAYELQGNYERSFYYLEWLSGLKDSLHEEAQSKEIARLESIQEIEQAEKEAELSALALESEEHKNMIFTVALALTGILVVIVLISLNQKRKDNKLIKQQRDDVQEQKILVEEKNKEITDSIQYAKLLQDALLPDTSPLNNHFESAFVLYLPKDIVSGDFYWVAEPVKDLIAFAVGDCTGHGVPGALLTMMGQNYLHHGLTEKSVDTPGKALGYIDSGFKTLLNSKESHLSGQGMDVAMCSIHLPSKQLTYSGARNPLLIIRDGEMIEFKGDKRGIGESSGSGPFSDHTFEIKKNDSIYLFSDGFVDQFGGAGGKKYKLKPFKELLLSLQGKPMSEQMEAIRNEFMTWKGELEQLDDVCLIGVQV